MKHLIQWIKRWFSRKAPPKVLILVLSARKQPWGRLMDTSLETWDSEVHLQTRTLYYCGNTSEPSTENVFYSPRLGEELCDVAPRTIEAFEKSLELEWDYMARPHSSTYVHKRNLVAFCETLPKENVLCGIMTEGVDPFLWGGCHYLFSRDVIEKMVANKDKWNNHVMEDHSITQLAHDTLKIPVTQIRSATINLMPDQSYLVMVYGIGENFSFTDWNDINKAQPHFHFRVKHDPDRSVDVKIMHKLYDHYC